MVKIFYEINFISRKGNFQIYQGINITLKNFTFKNEIALLKICIFLSYHNFI